MMADAQIEVQSLVDHAVAADLGLGMLRETLEDARWLVKEAAAQTVLQLLALVEDQSCECFYHWVHLVALVLKEVQQTLLEVRSDVHTMTLSSPV